jgi:pentatricopeptide repeat protein
MIAQHVRRTLDKGKFEEALQLTRRAGRDTKVTVSWNHLIDYQMEQQRLHAAVKLYNEMKKRGQLPDARTYTIIFRGCAVSLHPALAVAEAMRIYNTMLNTDRIKPNTIHLNAVLDVCARAGDIDAMFAIANSANEGLRLPNNQTFTIILNALRHKPEVSRKLDLAPQDVLKNTQEAIPVEEGPAHRRRGARMRHGQGPGLWRPTRQ